MTQTSRSQHNGRFVVVATCVYAAITFFVALHHAPWGDEADAWLASRDMTLSQLWPWMHYAGTPALWYLLLMPLAKLGLPYISMRILHWLLAVAISALILSLSPFPKIVRLALVFSYYISFEYAILARNYAPLILLLVLIAWLYPNRNQRPIWLGILLALLASASVHGTIFAAALLGAWCLEVMRSGRWSRRVVLGGIVAAAGVLLAVAEVLPSPADGQLAGTLVARNLDAADKILFDTFTPSYPETTGRNMARLHHVFPLFVAAWIVPRLLGAILLAGTVWLLRRNPPLLFAFIFSFLALLYVFVFKHIGGLRHTGLIWVLVWIMLWILRSDNGGSESIRKDRAIWKWGIIPIAISCIWSTGMAAYFLQRDIRVPYSGSKAAAAFLLEHHLADRPIAMFKDYRCEPILPYLGRKTVWYAGQDRYGTYSPWDRQWEIGENNINAAMARIAEKSAQDPSLVIVLSIESPALNADDYKLIFDNRHVPAAMSDESYAIYVRR